MARVALPASKVRARRRRRRTIGAGIVAAAVCALFGIAIWFSHAPFLTVDRVSALGLRTVDAAALEGVVREELKGRYGYIFSRNNILLYPKSDITAALKEKFPQFKVVEVFAQDFSTLTVQVVEREPAALWCDGSCYFMDEDGVVYAPAPRFNAETMVTYRGPVSGNKLPMQYMSAEEFHTLSAFASAIAQQESGDTLVGVAVDDVRDVRLRFESGFMLLYPLGEPGGDVYERYALARASGPFENQPLSNFAYLDLRFGDKLYYKTIGEE